MGPLTYPFLAGYPHGDSCSLLLMSQRTAATRQRLAVLMDFDGTLTDVDVGERLLDVFASPDWRREYELWRQGIIPSFKEMNEREFAYLPSGRREEMVRYALETVRLRPGAEEFVASCQAKGVPLEIVSGGLDFYIRPILADHGLGHLPLTCMKAADFTQGAHVRPTYPAGVVVCETTGACKCARLWRYQGQGYRTVYLGDGASDRCVARQADLLFARGSLARYCREESIPSTPFETFHEVMEALRGLEARYS